MNRCIPFRRPARRQQGITVLEILIALGLLVVFISFASPSLSGASARAEFKSAAEHMGFNIRMARNSARQLNTTVIMHLERERSARHHGVTYSLPYLEADARDGAALMDYRLPASVRIVSPDTQVRFDFRGIAEQPVQIELVSLKDDNLSHRFLIE